jgi:hypothetical protein
VRWRLTECSSDRRDDQTLSRSATIADRVSGKAPSPSGLVVGLGTSGRAVRPSFMLAIAICAVVCLAAAPVKAQPKLVNPEKSMVATIRADSRGAAEQIFRCAPLSSGLDIVRKTLGQHQIATVQTTAVDRTSGIVNLTTVLAHSSGEWIASDSPTSPPRTKADEAIEWAQVLRHCICRRLALSRHARLPVRCRLSRGKADMPSPLARVSANDP